MSAPETPEAPQAPPAPPLPFDRWVSVAARLLKRSADERLDVLEEEELDPAEWSRHDQHWTAQLAEDLDRGEDARIERYAALCAEELRARELASASSAPGTAANAGTTAPESAGTNPPVLSVMLQAAPAPAPPAVTPPAVALAPEPAPATPPGSVIAQTAFSAATPEPPGPVAPPAPVVTQAAFSAAAPEPPALVAPAASAAPKKPGLTETVQGTIMPVPGRALPFGDRPSQGPAQTPPTPGPAASPAPKPPLSGETMPLGVSLMALVTPFVKPGAPASAAPAAMPAAQPAPPPGPPAPHASTTAAHAARPAPHQPPAASQAPASAPRAATAAPEMTLDAYASLCAEMVVRPQHRADVLRRYSIAGEAALGALHAHWRDRFAREPAVEAQFQNKYKTFRDWLAQQR